jgi:hypothetical protein
MKVEQSLWSAEQGWTGLAGSLGETAQLLLLFGGTDVLTETSWHDSLQQAYPNAIWFGCSTAGEICNTRVFDESLVATAVSCESTSTRSFQTTVSAAGGSRRAGELLAGEMADPGLCHVFVLSDGHRVNGSELVRGLLTHLPQGVQVTGGMAGDGARFERTLVLADSEPTSGAIAALAFYGERLAIGYGSIGGWDAFGPERLVTRSEGNVLYELDDRPALDLYKTYLGEHSADLPSSGLLFPLSIQRKEGDDNLVRSIIAVDEQMQSLTFAGDIPIGSRAQLMKANFERLIDGASDAANLSVHNLAGRSPQLAILISCVGRKLVLRQRTEEEVEVVREVLGPEAVMTGFYSYGEICPVAPTTRCELHNQTMTITTFAER